MSKTIPTMTKLWLDEVKIGDEVRREIRIDWNNGYHHAVMLVGPATPERVAQALHRVALLVTADMAGAPNAESSDEGTTIATRDELRKDAERYRWLRGGPERPCGDPCAYRWQLGDQEHGTPIGGETLDAAIDAAMKGSNA